MVKEKIQMVDLKGQYRKIKEEVNQSIQEVLDTAWFIGGPKVKAFQEHLASYLDVGHVIPCANGTDALQIAMMALDLQEGDEVIVPTFTYVATAEVIGLLNLKPVMVDVDPNTFNITADILEAAITPRTKAVVPVHLFGQSSDMAPIMEVANKHGIYVVEDNAQAIGSYYTLPDGSRQRAGTIGHIGCTSFFPSKNLGCYGDGGAMYSNDDDLAQRLRMIANHGQRKKYHHSMIGCNSRLDALQAAVLDIKLKYLDQYSAARQQVAAHYDQAFASVDALQTPTRQANATHVFHQYTLKVKDGRRDQLKAFLLEKGIPSMIYYPIPLYRQDAFKEYVDEGFELPVTERLCQQVISLPIHTEMDEDLMQFISHSVREFFQ
ncbi:MAG: DegT/DnrJ/EryC1/StrS family aminotransferase [Bacteroidota bacterium]